MNIFDEYTHNLIESFNIENVEYLVFGGYAVNYYGYYRTTGDIDLWIKPDNENKIKVLLALKKIGIEENILSSIKKLDFTKHFCFQDGERPYRIDFLNYVSGVSFEDAWPQREITELDGLKIAFISFNHLILTKFTSNRPKDKIDLDELQKIAALRNNKRK